MAALVGTSDAVSGRRYEVGAELVIGREGQALTIDDGTMSRRHAVVRSSGEALTVEDLGSRNGTFVNGRRISELVSLAPDDVITLGATSFRVDVDASTPATVASVPVPAPVPVPVPVPAAAPAPAHRARGPRAGAAFRRLSADKCCRPTETCRSESPASSRAHRDLRRDHNRRAVDSLLCAPLSAAGRFGVAYRSASAMITTNATRTKIASGAVRARRFVFLSRSGARGDSGVPRVP